MREELLRIRGGFVAAAAIAALLLAAGCGGGSGDSSSATVGQVTVKTGSLSKDEFVEKADEICKTARKEFGSEYEEFLNAHRQQPQSVLVKEVVKSVVLPNFENEIQQISELGAPQDYAVEVASYLNALEQRLEEGRKNPLGLITAAATFKKATAIARKAGLNGCAQSLS